jgi:hypothetical protein
MLCLNTFVKLCMCQYRSYRITSRVDGVINGSISTNRSVDIPLMGVRSIGDCVKGNASNSTVQASTVQAGTGKTKALGVKSSTERSNDTKLLTHKKDTTVKGGSGSGSTNRTVKKRASTTAPTTIIRYFIRKFYTFTLISLR